MENQYPEPENIGLGLRIYLIASTAFLLYVVSNLVYFYISTYNLEGTAQFAVGIAFAQFAYLSLLAIFVSLFNIAVLPVFYEGKVVSGIWRSVALFAKVVAYITIILLVLPIIIATINDSLKLITND